jgi:hypothetical protein
MHAEVEHMVAPYRVTADGVIEREAEIDDGTARHSETADTLRGEHLTEVGQAPDRGIFHNGGNVVGDERHAEGIGVSEDAGRGQAHQRPPRLLGRSETLR